MGLFAWSLYARLRLPLAAASFTALVGGCTLPSEQLQLPGPITTSSIKPSISKNNQKYGVPLSDPASPEANVDRVYEGTGTFIATGQKSDGPSSGGSNAAKATETADGVTLNLSGATVGEFAQTVLGDILKLNYTVSQQAKANITLRTPQPVPKDKLLDMFVSVLKAENIEMVERGGVYVIGPSESVAQTGAPANWNGRGAPGASGTHAISLRYVAASEMERIIKSLAPGTRIVRADSDRNMLLVSGSPSELASINETVSVFDVDWMRGMSVGIFPIESGDPEAVAQELDTIFGNDRSSPANGMVRFIPNKRLRSLLVITSRQEYMRKAQDWIRRIDIAGQATEKQVHVYHVQNRPASELAELLRKVYAATSQPRQDQPPPTEPGRDTAVLTSPDAGLGAAAAPIAGAQASPPIPGLPAAAPNPALPEAAAQTLDGSATPAAAPTGAASGSYAEGDDRGSGISVVADVANNSLVITATHQEYRRVRQILSRIDIAPNQVLIEATIAEVTLNDQLQYGLKWYFQSKASQFTFTDATSAAVAAAGAAVSPAFPGFSYFLNMPNVQVALDALSTVTNVNIVSSPSLTVLDNKKATLQIGNEVPVATQSAVSVLAPGAPIVNSISFRNTGVILGITPRIGDNGRVLLDIEQEVSDVIRTTTSNLDSPTIQQRRIRTTVAVGDGESIVLAGLMQDRADVTNTQVPLLGDIPVVGNVFKTKENRIQRTELLIALSPHILKDPSQIRAVAAEFRDRMNFNTRPQRAGPPDRRENVERLLVR